MNIEDLNKLEEKVNNLVKGLKLLREENNGLKAEIEALKAESSVNSDERNRIKDKVATLIALIDSVEE